MLEISIPFGEVDALILKRYLTENNFQPKFSQKYKIYYSFIRPFIPIYIRQWIQRIISRNVKYKENFIDDEFVNLTMKTIGSRKTLRPQYYEGRESCIVLTHDVETAEGMKFIPRVIELEKQYGYRSSWNIVPFKYKMDEGIIRLIHEYGHEIGIHGYNHDGRLYYSEKIFRERARYINEALKRYGSVGFRSPMVHRNLVWLQELDIEYDASCFDYDPFQPFPGGTGSIWPFKVGKFIELPYTLPQDHTLFYVLNQKSIDIWKRKVDWVFKKNGVILTLTHPDYLMEQKHILLYEELLVYLNSFQNAWHCLPKELSSYFHEKIKSDPKH